ncbi:MAG: hypothetical protein HWE34_04475 [Methylocystaceae bacterium]|nr:hypothetical protein [Methylocystaceae bacterium]
MKYINPIGKEGDKVPYVDADPANGIEGDPVSSDAWEHPMLEIVNVQAGAGLTDEHGNTTQLLAAINALIAATQGTVASRDVGVSAGSVPEVLSATGKLDPSIIPTQSTGALRKMILLNSLLDSMRDATPDKIIDGIADPLVNLSNIDGALSSGISHDGAGAYLENLLEVYSYPVTGSTTMGTNVGGNSFSQLFDNNFNTMWDGENTQYWNAHTVTLDFNETVSATALDFAFHDYGFWPASVDVTIEVSDDNVTFTEHATVTFTVLQLPVSDPDYTYSRSTSFARVSFRYLRFRVLLNDTSWSKDLNGTRAIDEQTGAADVVSNILTTSATAVRASFMAFIEPTAAITYSTDLTLEFRTDDAGVYELAAIEKIGTSDEGYDIVYVDHAVAANSGTDNRFKLHTTAGNFIKLHGYVTAFES